jgi:uncharacterized repeat protein (TIGR03803 family)
MKNALQHRNWISRLTLPVLSALLLIAARPVQAQTLTVLYNFSGGSDGGNPNALLTVDDEGNLYGTTYMGGLGYGTVFELSPNGSGGWNETVLYSFTGGLDGAYPEFSNVIFDDNGNLYGTTGYGGTNEDGVVFELSPVGGGWTETVLYNFAGGTDGANPMNGLIMDQAGNLYGITINGGTKGGTVFELSPPSGGSGPWPEQVIYNVAESNEAFPPGLTMVVENGNETIFGTSDSSVFELSPNGNGGWNPTVIHNFSGTPTGAPAFYEGNLYGETEDGGSGFGTVFELVQENGVWQPKAKPIATFNFKTGSGPEGGLVFDAVGDIYGITVLGGLPEAGNLFELVSLGTGHYKATALETFNFTDEEGYSPEGGLLHYNGSLYGTNSTGPESGGSGAAFAVTLPGANTVTTLTSSPNPSNFGESVTFTAVVTDILGGSPPDGETVSFMKGKTILGTGRLSGGVATFAISTLKVGATSVKAVYGGDPPDFQGSTSKPVKQVVN